MALVRRRQDGGDVWTQDMDRVHPGHFPQSTVPMEPIVEIIMAQMVPVHMSASNGGRWGPGL